MLAGPAVPWRPKRQPHAVTQSLTGRDGGPQTTTCRTPEAKFTTCSIRPAVAKASAGTAAGGSEAKSAELAELSLDVLPALLRELLAELAALVRTRSRISSRREALQFAWTEGHQASSACRKDASETSRAESGPKFWPTSRARSWTPRAAKADLARAAAALTVASWMYPATAVEPQRPIS